MSELENLEESKKESEISSDNLAGPEPSANTEAILEEIFQDPPDPNYPMEVFTSYLERVQKVFNTEFEKVDPQFITTTYEINEKVTRVWYKKIAVAEIEKFPDAKIWQIMMDFPCKTDHELMFPYYCFYKFNSLEKAKKFVTENLYELPETHKYANASKS